jgi:hypothetical protein
LLQAGTRPPRPWQAAEAALRSPEYLRALFATREGRLLALLGSAVAGSGVQPSKDEQFDTWMKQESDLVQVRAFLIVRAALPRASCVSSFC